MTCKEVRAVRRNLKIRTLSTHWENRFWVTDLEAPFITRSTSGGAPGDLGTVRGGSDPTDHGLLSDRDLRQIEREYPDGMTSVQVVDVITRRGIRFSEATLRKYVQQGLLPRSRRIGRKGKHQGSLGLYPATTVRRINAIKQLMAENYTIEDIQQQFLRFRDEIEALQRGAGTLLSDFQKAVDSAPFDAQARRELKKEISEAKRQTDDLLRRIEQLERRITEPRERPLGTGAPGGAEDLL